MKCSNHTSKLIRGKKDTTYVKDEGSNLNAITNALKSYFVIIHCFKKKHHQRTKKSSEKLPQLPTKYEWML
jgi:hypothetical protein